MVLINYATKEIVAKVVYYGPALCGKTTNLQYIYTKLSPKKRGKMISLSTESDRTLFFDFLPMELGKIQGFKVRFQLYTVPGQVFYGATRKLVLKGADAVVFVADSQEAVLDMNIESIEDMKQNLIENGLDPDTIPLVIQYNKRDLNGIMEVDELENRLNWRKVPHTEAVAITGPGVMDTFFEITKALIQDMKKKHSLMDTDAIKELPPDIFEQEKEPEPEVLEAEDMVLEIEHGSGYRDESEEEEVVAGEMLDMMETISLSDSSRAEEFFDDVRQGMPTEEAKEKILSTAAGDKKIELSETAKDMEIKDALMTADDIPLMTGERELTPDEISMSGEPMIEPAEKGGPAGEPDITALDADLHTELSETPVPEAARKQPPAAKPKAKPAMKAEPQKTKDAAAKAPAPPAPAAASPETEKRFDNIQETLALLAKDVSRLGVRLEKQAEAPASSAPAAPAAPDKRIDAVLETLTHLGKEITSLGGKFEMRAGQPAQTFQGPDISPDISEVKDALGRIEQEVSALRLALTMMKESTSNALQAAHSTGGGPELKAEFDELRREFKEAFEGQDRLLLSIIEATRETRKSNTDSHEKLEDAIKYLMGSVKGDVGKKKRF